MKKINKVFLGIGIVSTLAVGIGGSVATIIYFDKNKLDSSFVEFDENKKINDLSFIQSVDENSYSITFPYNSINREKLEADIKSFFTLKNIFASISTSWFNDNPLDPEIPDIYTYIVKIETHTESVKYHFNIILSESKLPIIDSVDKTQSINTSVIEEVHVNSEYNILFDLNGIDKETLEEALNGLVRFTDVNGSISGITISGLWVGGEYDETNIGKYTYIVLGTDENGNNSPSVSFNVFVHGPNVDPFIESVNTDNLIANVKAVENVRNTEYTFTLPKNSTTLPEVESSLINMVNFNDNNIYDKDLDIEGNWDGGNIFDPNVTNTYIYYVKATDTKGRTATIKFNIVIQP